MSYTKTATLPVSPDEAFALITDPERLRRWQTVSAYVDLRAGGDFRWTVTPGHVAAGTYKELEPGKRIVFGWGWEGSDDLPPDASTVTVVIEPAGDGSTVTLTHDGLTPDQATSHAMGWDHYFERLQALASSGDAGPDEWAFAPETLDPITAAEASLAVLQPVLRNLTQDDQPKQTPCTEFTGHQLAEHLMGSLVSLGAMAGGTVENPEEGSLENRISVMTQQAVDAWRQVDLAGTVKAGENEMPAGVAGNILAFELALHAWDFAQTSGQTVHISEELVTYLRACADHLVPGGRDRGAFAAEVCGTGRRQPDRPARCLHRAYAGPRLRARLRTRPESPPGSRLGLSTTHTPHHQPEGEQS